jgi:hypothetical protein
VINVKKDEIREFSGNKKHWKYLNEQFHKQCFWSQLAWDNQSGLDGEVYSIEYYSPEKSELNENYFRVLSWSPEKSSMMKKLSFEIIQAIEKMKREK